MEKEQIYYDIISKAIRIVTPILSEFVCSRLKNKHEWWKRYVLNKLSDTAVGNLPKEGTYEKCKKSLDIRNCLKIIEKNWNDIFKMEFDNNHRNYVFELYNNLTDYMSHYTEEKNEKWQEEKLGERTFDTLERFIRHVDSGVADQILEIKNNSFNYTTPKLLPSKPKRKNVINPNFPPINPNFPCKVFLFPIHKSIKIRGVYEATRAIWKIDDKEYLDINKYNYAVGLVSNISKGTFKIKKWYDC